MAEVSRLDEVYGTEILFSGGCNMTCSYCYIHKNPSVMHDYNGAIRDSIVNGKFQKNVMNALAASKDKLESVSLWGGEPSVNNDLYEQFIVPILDYFKKVDNIMFSTNGKLGFEKGLRPFIDVTYNYAKKHNRHLNLEIQFSVDGPEWLSDISRNEKGITKTIINTIYDTVDYCSGVCDETFSFTTYAKPTVDCSWWRPMIEQNKVFEWYKFFNDIQANTKKLRKNNQFIELRFDTEPTLVTPYPFTKKDGIDYRDWLRAIKALDISKLPEYRKPLIHRYITFWRTEIGSREFSLFNLKCSAGLNCVTVNYKGELMSCHRVYDSYSMGGERNNTLALDCEIVKVNSNEKERIDYVNGVYHQTHNFKRSIVDGALLALVNSGEIDKKYLEPEFRALIYIFLGPLFCFAGECEDLTHNHYLVELGFLRLLCNGALEELIDDYYKNLH